MLVRGTRLFTAFGNRKGRLKREREKTIGRIDGRSDGKGRIGKGRGGKGRPGTVGIGLAGEDGSNGICFFIIVSSFIIFFSTGIFKWGWKGDSSF